MATSLQDIQNQIASFLDNSASAPSHGSKTWALRSNYINHAQKRWSEIFDWSTLYQEYSVLASVPTTQTTLSLPTDYRKAAGYAIIDGDKYRVAEPWETPDIDETSSRWVNILGTPGNYDMVVYTPDSFDSNVSLIFSYYHVPASLVSPADTSPIPDPDYLVRKAISYELRAKEDQRYADEDTWAEVILQRMIATENVKSYGHDRRIKTPEEKMNFRIGQD